MRGNGRYAINSQVDFENHSLTGDRNAPRYCLVALVFIAVQKGHVLLTALRVLQTRFHVMRRRSNRGHLAELDDFLGVYRERVRLCRKLRANRTRTVALEARMIHHYRDRNQRTACPRASQPAR